MNDFKFDARTLDVLHYLSTGAASFARGLNDTPKMVALFLVTPGFDIRWAFAGVAVMIALGGLLDADRVAETLGKKVTDMNPGQGFAASLVTAGLVTTAAFTACRSERLTSAWARCWVWEPPLVRPSGAKWLRSCSHGSAPCRAEPCWPRWHT